MWDMSIDMRREIQSISSEATEALGANIGARLRGGEVIELVSDLGGGKTTFTRGLVKGAGSEDAVSSPTFTISKIYQAQELQIHHFDLYRLDDAGLMAHEISELLADPSIVLVLEWAGVANNVLPEDRTTIHLQATDETMRIVTIEYTEPLAYLVEGIE
jgi:tRNA threonylcarbamoyladenosine biosynthesis protein TsaE